MKTMLITPRWDNRAAFTLTEGDRVIVVDTRGIQHDRPAVMSVHTVTRIMGGAKRQWLELDGKTEWASNGQQRGDDDDSVQELSAYNADMLAKNRAAWVEYKEVENLVSSLMTLSIAVTRSSLRKAFKQPEVRAAAKAFLALLSPPDAKRTEVGNG